MIGRLRGRLAGRGLDHVLIDVGGVGYVVTISERTRMALPAMGEAISLHTDLLVREDLLQLFGFLSEAEREWHRLLMSVQGIGAKASMAILGVLDADGVSRAITLGDWNAIARAKGVGPKTAQRVVNELKDKAPAMMAMAGEEAVLEDMPPAPEPGAAPAAAPRPTGVARGASQAEALSALANLGYAPGEAASAVAEAIEAEPEAETAALIRAALKRLAPKG